MKKALMIAVALGTLFGGVADSMAVTSKPRVIIITVPPPDPQPVISNS